MAQTGCRPGRGPPERRRVGAGFDGSSGATYTLVTTVVPTYDWTVIDTPSCDVDVPRAVLRVADAVVVPWGPLAQTDALWSTVELLASTQPEHRARPWAVLLTQVSGDTRRPGGVRDMLAGHQVPVLDAEVPRRNAVARAFAQATTTLEYAPVVADVMALAGGG